MPDVYIARSGVDLETLDERFKGAEVDTLRNSLAKVEQEGHIKAEQIHQLETSITAIRENFHLLQELLAANPSVAELEQALRRKKAREPLNDQTRRPPATAAAEDAHLARSPSPDRKA